MLHRCIYDTLSHRIKTQVLVLLRIFSNYLLKIRQPWNSTLLLVLLINNKYIVKIKRIQSNSKIIDNNKEYEYGTFCESI
jgi:hypothetical protein